MWPFSKDARSQRRLERYENSIERRRERDDQEALLVKAASQGEVFLLCHRDTWEFIALECTRGRRSDHFMPPRADEIADAAGNRLAVPLSGRSLSAVLDEMMSAAFAGVEPTVEKAVAAHVRDKILQALNSDDSELPYIIIDAHREDDEGLSRISDDEDND